MNTTTTSSSSSINFIDSTETKSSETCSNPPSPSCCQLTTIVTTSTTVSTTSSSNSMVKSLIQSYTSLSQNNSNHIINGLHENGIKNRQKSPCLSLPMTSSSSSLQSPIFTVNNTANNNSDYDNNNNNNSNTESKMDIHKSSNKLTHSIGLMRVPLSTNKQSDTDQQFHSQQQSQPPQQQQLPSKLSHLTNSKTSSASLYLRGPHPTSKPEINIISSNSLTSSTSCTTLVTCSPTINTITQPIPLPIKMDSIFHAKKSTSRRSQENNSNSLTLTTPITNSLNKNPITKDDSRRYLSELDSVIKELCEANEAAVQATRIAAQRRQLLGGWSTSNNSTSTNESKPIPISNSTNA
ncbi:unnamed protein product [Heterobilharzia americana]|nr:unnamed protein product [Heterobilharzia americana]